MSETDVLQAGAVLETATDPGGRRRKGPLPERCYACAAPVRGPYCYACGQRNDDNRRSVWSLFGESVRDVVNLDGRFARTVRSITLRPGRYLREYGRGVRSPYTPPVRFFLVMTFAFFAALAVTDRQIVVFQPEVSVDEAGKLDFRDFSGGFFAPAKDLPSSEAERKAMLEAVRRGDAAPLVEAEGLRAEAAAEIEALLAEAEAEAAEIREEGGPGAGAMAAGVLAEARGEAIGLRAEMEAEVAGIRAQALGDAAASDAPAGEAGLPLEGETLTLNGREFDGRRLAEGLFRLAENPRLFNAALGDAIPKIMILMVPLMALLGAMFVRGPDALLYDHAILSLNTHAVAFGLLTLGLLTAAFLPGWVFAAAVFAGVPYYYYRAVRGAFGRRRRKVIVATAFVFLLYWIVLTTALTAAAVGAFADTL